MRPVRRASPASQATGSWTAGAVLTIALPTLLAMGPTPQAPPNTLTTDERAAGWHLLFDGVTMDQWRAFRHPDARTGWQVQDGTISLVPADLITRDEFADFEFAFDWKLVRRGGNSGVMFRAVEGRAETYHSGPEMQLLDNAGHDDGKVPETSVGANYALHAPARDASKPIGEWNAARIVADGAHVEHWLNGQKVVEYELWTPDWAARVAASKFRAWPQYGQARRGHIVLQDHGNAVAFRNLKIRVR